MIYLLKTYRCILIYLSVCIIPNRLSLILYLCHSNYLWVFNVDQHSFSFDMKPSIYSACQPAMPSLLIPEDTPEHDRNCRSLCPFHPIMAHAHILYESVLPWLSLAMFSCDCCRPATMRYTDNRGSISQVLADSTGEGKND